MEISLAELSRMKKSLIPDILVFTRIIELGTFAAVAEETGYTSSGISRMISRIEDGLGVKLLHRTTRKLTLTAEGEVFLGYARNFLTLEEATEAELSKSIGEARGHLRVNCGTAFATHKLTPILPMFLEKYPDITIDISVTDRRVDPIAEQLDVTIRVGELQDSDLIAVRLGTVRRVIAASPAYLELNGKPNVADDLSKHVCLRLAGFSGQAVWPMREDGQTRNVCVNGPVTSDSADVLLHMAIQGVGIIRLGDFLGEAALSKGQLVELFSDSHDDDPKPLTALIMPKRQHIRRVKVFVDFLRSEI